MQLHVEFLMRTPARYDYLSLFAPLLHLVAHRTVASALVETSSHAKNINKISNGHIRCLIKFLFEKLSKSQRVPHLCFRFHFRLRFLFFYSRSWADQDQGMINGNDINGTTAANTFLWGFLQPMA